MNQVNVTGRRPLLLLLAGVALVGCMNRELAPANPCTRGVFQETLETSSVTQVDLLIVIDDSSSMWEEQKALEREIPRLVQVLTSGDLDPSQPGPEFSPVEDLNIGVISTDMGTGGTSGGSLVCPDSGPNGRDGVLVSPGDAEGCEAETMNGVLSFDDAIAGGATPAQYASAVECLASLGESGCGIEQPLEAVLKALTPSTSGIRFLGGGTGHGDGQNAGFLRPDSVLAVILLTDEDDCSIADVSLYQDHHNLSCWQNPEKLQRIERFVDGLAALRSEHPERLIFSVIGGLPTGLSATGTPDFNAILNHPDMMRVEDPTRRSGRRPVCQSEDGLAYPARRLVSAAAGLAARGADTSLHSICANDFRPAVSAVLEKIAQKIDRGCLSRQLSPDAAGMVGCEVVEVLPASGDYTECDDIPGRRSPREGEGPAVEMVDGLWRNVCYVQQLPARVGGATDFERLDEPGWHYAEAAEGSDDLCEYRLVFTPGSEPRPGTRVRLSCLQPQVPEWEGGDAYPGAACSSSALCEPTESGARLGCVCSASDDGSGCQSQGTGCGADACQPVAGTGVDADAFCGGTLPGSTAAVPGMICERASQTCQVACQADVDCLERLGRGGYTCHPDTNICVNAVCE